MGYQGYQGYGPKADIASLLIQQQAAQANGMKGAPGAGAPFPPSQYPQSAGGPDLGAIPDIGSAQQQAGSSRKIADLLMDRAMSRNQQGDVVNWGTGLGQLGEALLARNANKKADAAEANLATAEGDKRQQIAQLLAGASNASPQQQALLQAGVGMEAAAQQAFAPPPEPKDPFVVNNQVVSRENPTQVLADYRDPQEPDKPQYSFEQIGEDIVAINPADPNDRMVVGKAPVKTPLVNVNTGDMPSKDTLTPFELKMDEIYAPMLADWNTGGASDAAKGIDQMNEVVTRLENPDANLTGYLIGLTPDFVARGINPAAVDTRELAEEVVQRNLRIILGAQFTAKEGDRLIARAYNKGLSEPENAARIKRLVQSMDGRAQQMNSLNEYINKFKTSSGWNGKIATVDELLAEMDTRSGGRNSPQKRQESNRFPAQGAAPPPGVDPEDWEYLTPEERAAFQ
jgi:hypothetical protein